MKVYNINSVSRITGITPFVIRAWEKRYNVVSPGRTETNRRFYSEDDIEKLKLLKQAVDRGNSIRNVASMSVDSLKEMLNTLESEPAQVEIPEVQNVDEILKKCLDAVKELDHRSLEKYLIRTSIEHSHPFIIQNIILPLLKEIGICWHKGSLRIAQEHMASAVIRTFLYNLRDEYKHTENSQKIIITTPVGQQHEFGALAASLIASLEGWDSIYLGPDLPSSEIIAAAEQMEPSVVALSIAFITDDKQLLRELQALKNLPPNVKLVIGGAGSAMYKDIIENINGLVLPDFDSFSKFLQNPAYK